jgi:transposase
VKLTNDHVELLIDKLNVNPHLTLKEMCEILLQDLNIRVSVHTVARRLHGRMISLKTVHQQPDGTNTLANKRLRKEYVEAVMKVSSFTITNLFVNIGFTNFLFQATGDGKTVVYIDESNVNLFLRRNQGRAAIGSRAITKMPNSRGANIHMIGAMTQTSMIKFMRKRGSFKSEDFLNWLKMVVTTATTQGIPLNNIVLVIDNAPCHSKAENITLDYPEVVILRLAPYSPMLNPIEMAWSTMKAAIKQKEAASLEHLTPPPNCGLSQTEWRLRIVEKFIDESLETVTPIKCMRFVNHVQKFFPDALTLKDMPAGD